MTTWLGTAVQNPFMAAAPQDRLSMTRASVIDAGSNRMKSQDEPRKRVNILVNAPMLRGALTRTQPYRRRVSRFCAELLGEVCGETCEVGDARRGGRLQVCCNGLPSGAILPCRTIDRGRACVHEFHCGSELACQGRSRRASKAKSPLSGNDPHGIDAERTP